VRYIGKGVCWGPDVDGETFYKNYVMDIALMQQIGANCARTYRPPATYNSDGVEVDKTKEMLDAFQEAGIQLVIGFSERDMRTFVMRQFLENFGNHPAILMYMFGNEQNRLYGRDGNPSENEWRNIVREALATARQYTGRPIGTVLADDGSSVMESIVAELQKLDVILINVYRNGSIGNAEAEIFRETDRVFVGIGEAGMGSYGYDNREDRSQKQADAVGNIIDEIQETNQFGFIFMLRDDFTKRGEGPNGEAENSFGIFDEDGNPKPAADVVKEKYSQIPDSVPFNEDADS
jgi:hypothetical protein